MALKIASVVLTCFRAAMMTSVVNNASAPGVCSRPSLSAKQLARPGLTFVQPTQPLNVLSVQTILFFQLELLLWVSHLELSSLLRVRKDHHTPSVISQGKRESHYTGAPSSAASGRATR